MIFEASITAWQAPDACPVVSVIQTTRIVLAPASAAVEDLANRINSLSVNSDACAHDFQSYI